MNSCSVGRNGLLMREVRVDWPGYAVVYSCGENATLAEQFFFFFFGFQFFLMCYSLLSVDLKNWSTTMLNMLSFQRCFSVPFKSLLIWGKFALPVYLFLGNGRGNNTIWIEEQFIKVPKIIYLTFTLHILQIIFFTFII